MSKEIKTEVLLSVYQISIKLMLNHNAKGVVERKYIGKEYTEKEWVTILKKDNII